MSGSGTPHEELSRIQQQVLASDSENVEALYLRDQDPKELGNLEDFIPDLSKAQIPKVFTGDETNTDASRDAYAALREEDKLNAPRQDIAPPLVDAGECSQYVNETGSKVPTLDPEFSRSIIDNSESNNGLPQNLVPIAESDSLPALGSGGIPAEIVKTATDMISFMEAEDLQKMLQVAFSLNVKGPILNTFGSGSRPGFEFPEMTSEMIKMASERVSNMSPEELHKMLEVSPMANMNAIFSPRPTPGSNTLKSRIGSESPFAGSNSGESSYNVSRVNSFDQFQNMTADMQENIVHSMDDPTTQQIFRSMIRSLSSEMMTSMIEHGMDHSGVDEVKAQQPMASLLEDDLGSMVQLEGRAEEGNEAVDKAVFPYMGKAVLVLSISMLILAFVLHRS